MFSGAFPESVPRSISCASNLSVDGRCRPAVRHRLDCLQLRKGRHAGRQIRRGRRVGIPCAHGWRACWNNGAPSWPRSADPTMATQQGATSRSVLKSSGSTVSSAVFARKRSLDGSRSCPNGVAAKTTSDTQKPCPLARGRRSRWVRSAVRTKAFTPALGYVKAFASGGGRNRNSICDFADAVIALGERS